jgi:hypothetical protein
MIKGFFWPSSVYSEHLEEQQKVGEGEVEELQEEPVKRYNLRERKPVDYQES